MSVLSGNPARIRILGIDPGSRVTGYGIVDVVGGADPMHVAHGCIVQRRGELAERLRAIYSGVADLVTTYAPDELAIEQVFVAHNVDSALKLGQARGAALCGAMVREGLSVFEYSAREIKQAVAGRGGAEKTQVQTMVHMLLSPGDELRADAADALATALCRAFVRRTEAMFARAAPEVAAADAGGPGGESASDLLRQAHAWRTRRRRR